MTDGKTQLVGLLGWPVEHSLSPTMHNAAFDALDLNWHYVPLPVPRGQVAIALRGLAALGFRGANVTVPHKQEAMRVVDRLAPNAQALGAVNTLIVERSEANSAFMNGKNTDVDGVLGALREGGLEPQSIRNAVVVGAGGAARATVYALLNSGTAQIVLLNRTLERAELLLNDLGHRPEYAARLHALPLGPEALVESVRAADLLINATPVGMWPDVNRSIWPDDLSIPPQLTVFDLVYSPLETRLLRQARRSGANTLDGLGMLVLQGAIAFEMWTEKARPVISQP